MVPSPHQRGDFVRGMSLSLGSASREPVFGTRTSGPFEAM